MSNEISVKINEKVFEGSTYDIDCELPSFDSVNDFMVLSITEEILDSCKTAIERAQTQQEKDKKFQAINKKFQNLLKATEDDSDLEDFRNKLLKIQKESAILLTSSKKSGRKKIDENLAISLLEACYLCDQYEISPKWIQQLFLPNNVLYQHLIEEYHLISIQIPLPSSQTYDKSWYYNFKLSLERSLFGKNDCLISDPIFLQKKEAFKKQISEKQKRLHIFVTRNFDKLQNGEYEFGRGFGY